MAHDLDFRRPTKAPSQRATTPVSPNEGRLSQPKKRNGMAPLFLAIVGIAAAAIGAYYWASKPPTATAPAVSSTTDQQNTATAPDSGKNIFQKTDQLVVQVYESGASQEVVTQSLATLKEKGFTTENLGKSQFEYDKTYIWHTAEYTKEAKTVGDSLTGRVVSYKESQNAGLFDILVYLGKQ